MLKAKDIMSEELITVTPATPVIEAARILLDKRINGLPVLDEAGQLVGIICQSDLVAQQKRFPIPSMFNVLDGVIPISSPKLLEKEMQKIAASRVAEAMSSNPETVNPETSLEEIATLMVSKGFHTLPVVERGKLVGIIGKEDVLRTLLVP